MHSIQIYDCPICLEVNEDLKCIPCWHIICKTCIIGLKEKERTAKCPLCREFFLSGNIENLPNPISCHSCQHFVVNPQKFQSCSHVYCSECVARLRNDGQELCSDCNSGLQSETKSLRICQRCHLLHNDVELPCRPDIHLRHSLCENCFQQDPVCTLCKFIEEDRARSLRMQRIFPEQAARMFFQNRRFNSQVGGNLDNPENLAPNSQPGGKYDLARIILFTLSFLFLGFYFGIGYQLWLASIGFYFLFRPKSIHMVLLMSMCLIWLRILFLYYHFYITLKIWTTQVFFVSIVSSISRLDIRVKNLMLVIFDLFINIYLPLFHDYPIYFLHWYLLSYFQNVFILIHFNNIVFDGINTFFRLFGSP